MTFTVRTFRLDAALWRAICKAAQGIKRSRSWVVRTALVAYLGGLLPPNHNPHPEHEQEDE